MYEMGEEEIAAIRRVLDSGKLFRFQGENVPTECSQFEAEFAQKMDSKYCVLTTSGTNALVAAFAATGIGPGDEVLVPSFTFFATVAAVLQVQAIPIIVNIDDSLGLSVEEMKKHLSEKTKAIVPVHMDGLNCDMDAIMAFANKKNLIVIEDVAQAVGGSYRGRALGTIGHMGCYSFNVDKNITCGEGGALVTNNELLYQRALCFHDSCVQFGWTHRNSFTQIVPFVGASMRVSEISGAMLRVQLAKLDQIIEKLRKRKKLITASLCEAGIPLRLAHDTQGDCGSSIHINCGNPLDCQEIAKKLIQSGYKAIPIQARPAHAVWQWMHLLENQQFYHPEMNPFKRTKKTYSYSKSQYLTTISLLMSTLKISIDYNLSTDETKVWVDKLIKLIKNEPST